MLLVLSGCATHAQITMPTVENVYHQEFDNKSFTYDILYSQPKPGIFSGGEQLALAPLSEVELSVASSKTLKGLPELIFEQLPATAKRANAEQADYQVIVELIAHDKLGPAYADHETMKSMGKSLVTLGLGSSEYDIVADFDVTYKLSSKGEIVFEKAYKVNESVDHEKGSFDSFNTLDEFTSQLLEKHFILTLNDFFKEATQKI